MELTLRTDNLRLTDELDDYVQKKMSKLERYMPNIESIHVDLGVQNNSKGLDVVVAQITVRHDRGAILRTEEKVEKQDYNSVKVAVNSATDKMHRRIRRFKGKSRSKRLRERYAMTPEEFTAAEPLPEEAETETGEETLVVRRKVVGVTVMHEEEAIEQMELLGHSFFMFVNTDNDNINVVYKRASGGYGLLVPELA